MIVRWDIIAYGQDAEYKAFRAYAWMAGTILNQ